MYFKSCSYFICFIVFISCLDFSSATISADRLSKLGSRVLNILSLGSNTKPTTTQNPVYIVPEMVSNILSSTTIEGLNAVDPTESSAITKTMDDTTVIAEVSTVFEMDNSTQEERRGLNVLSEQVSSQSDGSENNMNNSSLNQMRSKLESNCSNSDECETSSTMNTNLENSTDSSNFTKEQARTFDLFGSSKSSDEDDDDDDSMSGMDHSSMNNNGLGSQVGSNMGLMNDLRSNNISATPDLPELTFTSGLIPTINSSLQNATDSSNFTKEQARTFDLFGSSKSSSNDNSMSGMDHSSMNHNGFGSQMGSNMGLMNDLRSSNISTTPDLPQLSFTSQMIPTTNSSLENGTDSSNFIKEQARTLDLFGSSQSSSDDNSMSGMDHSSMNHNGFGSQMDSNMGSDMNSSSNSSQDVFNPNERSLIWDTLMGFNKENSTTPMPMNTIVPSLPTTSVTNDDVSNTPVDVYIPPLQPSKMLRSILGFPQRG